MHDDTHHLDWHKSIYSTQNRECVEVAAWRKSTRSTQNGSCVEVAPWRSSSRSAQNGECVELAAGAPGVAVRDSKAPDGPYLLFAPDAWGEFAAHAKAGEWDLTTS